MGMGMAIGLGGGLTLELLPATCPKEQVTQCRKL